MVDRTAYLTVTFLAAIAGFVDAVGYLSLHRVYTANMSGNSVAVGIQLGWQNWPELLRRFWPVVAFVAGMLFCRILVDIGARRKMRSIASVAILFEIGLLLPACLLNSPRPEQTLYVGLLAIAMGIQNAAVTRVQSASVHTGFVTGVLLNSITEFAKYLTWLFDCVRSGSHSFRQALAKSTEQKPFHLALWLMFVWISYVIGACCGTLGQRTLHFEALGAPILALLIVIAIDLRHPLAAEEEQSQKKGS